MTHGCQMEFVKRRWLQLWLRTIRRVLSSLADRLVGRLVARFGCEGPLSTVPWTWTHWPCTKTGSRSLTLGSFPESLEVEVLVLRPTACLYGFFDTYDNLE